MDYMFFEVPHSAAFRLGDSGDGNRRGGKLWANRSGIALILALVTILPSAQAVARQDSAPNSSKDTFQSASPAAPDKQTQTTASDSKTASHPSAAASAKSSCCR